METMPQQHFFRPDRSRERQIPSARGIRRTCNKELYRTVKRMNIYIPPDKIQQAEQLYFKKVILNLQWITENGNRRKQLADWWVDEVAPEIAELWKVDVHRLASAFRHTFGG